jgi:hypothetical protein
MFNCAVLQPPEDCLFSHDAEPPQVWELCKFYLFDRCVKKDKCLYLHKGFPCKYFHTGLDCKDDSVTCKFSHEPLNDMTRNLLLKVRNIPQVPYRKSTYLKLL